MRILYVNHTSLMSGAEYALLDLLSGLPAEVEPQMACPEGPLRDAVLDLGVPVHEIPGTAGSLRLSPRHTPTALVDILRMGLAIRRHSRRLGADLVHANSTRAGLAAVFAGSLGGARTVVHVRDCMPATQAADAVRSIIRRRAAAAIAISAYVADNFGGSTRDARLRVILDPIDLTPYQPADGAARAEARARLGVAGEVPLLTVIGQLTPWKGQDDAIRALGLLRKLRPHARLLIVGEPKFATAAARFDNLAYARSLRQLAQSLGLVEAVDFLGERPDVPAVLSAVDVALVPSWEEPLGRSVVEAMAMGVPVLATSVGGPAELIEDRVSGMLLPPRQPQQWADAADELLADTGLREGLAAAGRERVQILFGGSEQIEDLLDAYRLALHGVNR
jgi:L-malate glycosyltransferase